MTTLSICLFVFLSSRPNYLPIDLGVSSKSGLTKNPVTDTICGRRYAIRPALHYITLTARITDIATRHFSTDSSGEKKVTT